MFKAIKPFCKVVGLSTANQAVFTKVDLTDSEGSPINCNYIKCVVVPSGVNISTIPNDIVGISLSSTYYSDKTTFYTNTGISGTGGLLTTALSPQIIQLPYGPGVSSVFVSKVLGTNNLGVAIIYGVCKTSNILRINNRNSGN